MDTDIFCVLCGGPFALEQHVYNIDPDKKDFQWLYNVRLLGATSALHNHRMTSAGELHANYSGCDAIFLSDRIGWKITDFDCFQLGQSFYHVLALDEAGDALFPIHEACIDIARRFIKSHTSEQAETERDGTIEYLYHILQHHFQAGSHGNYAENDIFGLQTSNLKSGPRSILAIDELGWWSGSYEKFLTDPLLIPDLTPTIFHMLQPLFDDRTDGPIIIEPTRVNNGMEGLPNEVLDQITDLLSSKSFLTLRQLSRSLAPKLPLDDRFWRQRLCDGSLLPHLWDLDEAQLKQLLQHPFAERQVDWRGLLRKLTSETVLSSNQVACNRTDMPAGLWNRCRIWSIIEGACLRPHRHDYHTLKCATKPSYSHAVFDYSKASLMAGFVITLGLAAAWDLRSSDG